MDNRERTIKNEQTRTNKNGQSRTGKQKRIIKNGQSKDRGNDSHKTQHEKLNKKAQHRKLKR